MIMPITDLKVSLFFTSFLDRNVCKDYRNGLFDKIRMNPLWIMEVEHFRPHTLDILYRGFCGWQ